MRLSVNRALIGFVVVVMLVGLVPAGILLDRRLVNALEDRARADLSSAVLVLQDRFDNQAGARMMHAREIAGSPAVTEALRQGDSLAALVAARAVVAAFPEEQAVVLSPEGRTWLGPLIPAALVDATRDGGMPVEVVVDLRTLATVALAPVKHAGQWVGAAGIWVPFADGEAARLSALTRADVLLTAPDRSLVAYTGRAEPAMGLVGMLAELPLVDGVQDLSWAGARYFLAGATVPGGARITFVRPAEDAMALVPALRGAGVVALGLGLLVALLVGARAAAGLTRPVEALTVAAEQVAGGNLRAPIPRTRVTELDRMAVSFEAMRDTLAARIEELDRANQELEARQERLTTLQAEFIQRDRLSSTTRLLVQLAHEIRNPVAGVRNALELLRRRVQGDTEAMEFADLAIDELLRMHELAEHMLDIHRPRGNQSSTDATSVVREVAAVVRLGTAGTGVMIEADAEAAVPAAIGPDALKQVLLNLVQNAREAVGPKGRIVLRTRTTDQGALVEVEDDGPGIEPKDLPRLFDAFFTTKEELRGVGLGLYIAEGVVRGRGGRLMASNRAEGGARFTIEIPSVEAR